TAVRRCASRYSESCCPGANSPASDQTPAPGVAARHTDVLQPVNEEVARHCQHVMVATPQSTERSKQWTWLLELDTPEPGVRVNRVAAGMLLWLAGWLAASA